MITQYSEELIEFSKRLHLFQDRIIKEAIKIEESLIKRVEDKDDTLEDYDIEFQISFYLKVDDPEYDKCEDNIIARLTEGLKKLAIKKDKSRRWNNTNHSEFQNWDWHEMYLEHHCWLYHCLYDHTNLEWEDIFRIGGMQVDLRVLYQYFDGYEFR